MRERPVVADSAGRCSELFCVDARLQQHARRVPYTHQIRQRLPILRLPDLVGVVVRATFDQQKLLWLSRSREQFLAQAGQYQAVLTTVNHQQR